MTKKSQLSLVDRLINVKKTLVEAERYIADIDDSHHLAIGLSLLHDAIESLYWVISSVNKFGLQESRSFIEKFDDLNAEPNIDLQFDRSTLSQFNRIRNNYKHHGILPQPGQAQKVSQKILEDFENTTKAVLNIDIRDVSLTTLIADEELKERLREIEKEISAAKNPEDFKNILERIGRAYYDFYEERFAHSLRSVLLREEEKRYQFPDVEHDRVNSNLFELGMVPFYYYRFKNLVPTFGKDEEADKIVSTKESMYWTKENWNHTNVDFCLNWLTDFFLRKQWVYSRQKYTLERSRTFHLVAPKSNISLKNEHSGHIVELKKDEYYFAHCFDYVDGVWQDFDRQNKEEDAHIALRGEDFEAIFFTVGRDRLDIVETDVDEIDEDFYQQILENFDKRLKKPDQV